MSVPDLLPVGRPKREENSYTPKNGITIKGTSAAYAIARLDNIKSGNSTTSEEYGMRE
jgi:hypothetical protein